MSPAKKPAKKTAARSKGAAPKTSAAGSRTSKTSSRSAAAAKKTTAKKSSAPKTSAKKTAVKKTVAKKATPKKTSAKKATAKKTAVKKAAAPKKATAKKTAVKKAPPPKKATAKKTTARTPAPKKTAARPSSTARGPAPRAPRAAKLDKKQLAAIRERLVGERAELIRQQNELDAEGTQGESLAEAGLDDDFADAGTATFDRERDFSIRNNITDLIDQVTRAVSRIDEGTYGTCERCGRPIDAARLKALPHALLCLDCKRREERGR